MAEAAEAAAIVALVLHPCDKCPRVFQTRANLGSHQRIHQEHLERCPFCTAAFSRRGRLEEHVNRYHEREADYIIIDVEDDSVESV